MKNLFFISGPQGGGKTTLLERISDPDIIFYDVQLNRNKFDVEPQFRIQLKICQRAIENYCVYSYAKQNPDKIVIGNRCIYDQLVFDKVYVRKGWISMETQKKLDQSSVLFYHQDLLDPKAIILNPSFEVVKRHLEKRWEKKGKKWREEDQEYIKFACEGYKEYQNKSGIYYIDHEVNLDNPKEIETLVKWLKNSKSQE